MVPTRRSPSLCMMTDVPESDDDAGLALVAACPLLPPFSAAALAALFFSFFSRFRSSLLSPSSPLSPSPCASSAAAWPLPPFAWPLLLACCSASRRLASFFAFFRARFASASSTPAWPLPFPVASSSRLCFLLLLPSFCSACSRAMAAACCSCSGVCSRGHRMMMRRQHVSDPSYQNHTSIESQPRKLEIAHIPAQSPRRQTGSGDRSTVDGRRWAEEACDDRWMIRYPMAHTPSNITRATWPSISHLFEPFRSLAGRLVLAPAHGLPEEY